MTSSTTPASTLSRDDVGGTLGRTGPIASPAATAKEAGVRR